MKSNEELESDFSIDKNRLDDEWLDQPRRYFRYAAELADARRRLDEAKAEQDITKAEVEMTIRGNPEKFGLAKVTEAAVTATVLMQGTYQKAFSTTLKAKHDVDILSAATVALDHRKKSLENLVHLWAADYFSSPKCPDISREHFDEVGKQSVRTKGRRRAGTNDS